MRQLSVLALAVGRRSWGQVRATDISASWADALAGLVPLITALQLRAATEGAGYVADALADQGSYVLPDGFTDPQQFAGVAADGRSLEGLLYSPVVAAKNAVAAGMDVSLALAVGGRGLDRMVQTTIADTGRAAASVDITSRISVGWVRMLNPPSCSRCVILAGKWFRWNQGFLRHPKCDCTHIPSAEDKAGDLTTDPYEYFKSLAPEEQARHFTQAGADAINDGADMFQVVNSRRGMNAAGMKTTEGTSKRGNFYSDSGGKSVRLTPDAIYSLNGDNRAAALKDLEKYGYILPGGQDPLGSIVGQREGFGAMGRGGANAGARAAVQDARATGVRIPSTRATMTAAERRVFDARLSWDAVRAGRNPQGRGPLTPQIAAQVEKNYRRWLSTGGQVFVQ
ncbi:hypothetical protein [Specibacter sp. NPDC078692]|uniref:hypothetical protein n=1 Tax=Specibacter sp. NPDC078692 TaxID=3155818 RepID=UPI0034256139